MTHKQLLIEIEDEILAFGGRINVVELQSNINVDLVFIEEKIQQLVHLKNEFVCMNGQIIAQYYLDSVADEINSDLQNVGMLELARLAKKYSFPMSFLVASLETRIGSIIQGTMTKTNLYTASFVIRHNKRVRAAFSAITEPILVKTLFALHSFEEALAMNELYQLLSDSQIVGSLSGVDGRLLYTPNFFAINCERNVRSFLSSNSYIDYTVLGKFGISSHTSYMKSLGLSNLVYFDNCVILDSFFDPIIASIDEMFANSTWLDLQSFLPSSITLNDCPKLLKLCLKNQKALVHDFFLVSPDLLEQDLKKLMLAVGQLAEQVSKKLKTVETVTLVKEASDVELKEKKRGKEKGSKKVGRDEAKNPCKNAASTEIVVENGPSEAWVKEQIGSFHVEMPDDLINFLVTRLRPKLIETFDELKMQGHIGAAALRKRKHEMLAKLIDELFESASFFIAALEDGTQDFDQYLIALLHKYFLRTLGGKLVDLMINDCALMLSIDNRDVNSFTAPSSVNQAELKLDEAFDAILLAPITADERSRLVSLFPPGIKENFVSLIGSLTSKSCAGFLGKIEAASSSCELFLKPFTKKRAKQIVNDMRKYLVAQLASSDFTVVLLSTVLLLHSHASGIVLHAPSTAIPLLIKNLSRSLLPQIHSLLTSSWSDLELFNKSGIEPELATERSAIGERLDAALPTLRSIGQKCKESFL